MRPRPRGTGPLAQSLKAVGRLGRGGAREDSSHGLLWRMPSSSEEGVGGGKFGFVRGRNEAPLEGPMRLASQEPLPPRETLGY